jgi:hypothetical protein
MDRRNSAFCYLLTLHEVVRLEENLAQLGLTDRVVLGVELVESVESVAVGVHNRES